MKITVLNLPVKKVIIPHGKMAQPVQGDWFECQKCGHKVQMKVLGNYATCSECGGRMVRIS